MTIDTAKLSILASLPESVFFQRIIQFKLQYYSVIKENKKSYKSDVFMTSHHLTGDRLTIFTREIETYTAYCKHQQRFGQVMLVDESAMTFAKMISDSFVINISKF